MVYISLQQVRNIRYENTHHTHVEHDDKIRTLYSEFHSRFCDTTLPSIVGRLQRSAHSTIIYSLCGKICNHISVSAKHTYTHITW